MKSASFPLPPLALVALATAALTGVPSANAATNLLKGYIGASWGHANIRAEDADLISASPNSAFPGSQVGAFEVGHSAYQIAAGIRAVEVLGVEVDYFDLGSEGAQPSWSGAGALTNAHAAQHGEAAFALLYLPIPIVDAYLKAGAARLATRLSATATYSCQPGQACPFSCPVGVPCGGYSTSGALDTTETTFAAGAGVEWKLGNWAIRGEYERFGAAGEHPSLACVGVTWSFL